MRWGAIFPGQGSQSAGMGQFLDANFAEAKARFSEASEILGFDCRRLCFSGSEDELQLTENTQPMLLLTSVATFEVLQAHFGFRPTCAAGHSVGEYAALVAAKVISFADALRAVRARGLAMQKAVPVGEGGMCAVLGLSDAEVTELCARVEKESDLKPLSPANFNAPGQVVVSGRQHAIAWMQANAKVRAKFIPLKVSAPFHCQMMAPAEKTMAELLGKVTFHDAAFLVVQNYSARANSQGTVIRDEIIKQVTAPVRWTQCMQQLVSLAGDNSIHLVECGPGRVLAGLAKKIDSARLKVLNCNSLEDLKHIAAESLE